MPAAEGEHSGGDRVEEQHRPPLHAIIPGGPQHLVLG